LTPATTAFIDDAGDCPTQVVDAVGDTNTRPYDNRFDAAATEGTSLTAGTGPLTCTCDAAGRRVRTTTLLAVAWRAGQQGRRAEFLYSSQQSGWPKP